VKDARTKMSVENFDQPVIDPFFSLESLLLLLLRLELLHLPHHLVSQYRVGRQSRTNRCRSGNWHHRRFKRRERLGDDLASTLQNFFY